MADFIRSASASVRRQVVETVMVREVWPSDVARNLVGPPGQRRTLQRPSAATVTVLAAVHVVLLGSDRYSVRLAPGIPDP